MAQYRESTSKETIVERSLLQRGASTSDDGPLEGFQQLPLLLLEIYSGRAFYHCETRRLRIFRTLSSTSVAATRWNLLACFAFIGWMISSQAYLERGLFRDIYVSSSLAAVIASAIVQRMVFSKPRLRNSWATYEEEFVQWRTSAMLLLALRIAMYYCFRTLETTWQVFDAVRLLPLGLVIWKMAQYNFSSVLRVAERPEMRISPVERGGVRDDPDFTSGVAVLNPPTSKQSSMLRYRTFNQGEWRRSRVVNGLLPE